MNLDLLIKGFNEPKTLTYTNPHDPQNPLLLQVYAEDSRIAKNAYRTMQAKVFELAKDESNFEDPKGKKTEKRLKAELINELDIEYVSSLVADWSGLFDGDGNEVSFDKELLKQAIENNDTLRKAIYEFSANIEGNFQAV